MPVYEKCRRASLQILTAPIERLFAFLNSCQQFTSDGPLGKKTQSRLLTHNEVSPATLQTNGQFIYAPVELYCGWHNQFRRGARRGRAQIRHEIGNGEIDFMSDRGNNRDQRGCDRAGDNFLIKLP